jgi:hypothetical protein
LFVGRGDTVGGGIHGSTVAWGRLVSSSRTDGMKDFFLGVMGDLVGGDYGKNFFSFAKFFLTCPNSYNTMGPLRGFPGLASNPNISQTKF